LPNPDGSTQWPQTFEVDHVYVYDRTGTPVLSVDNADFETDDGSLSRWSLFGNSGINVSSDNSFAFNGSNALKVFGQFNGGENFSGIEQGASVQAGDELQVSARVFMDPNDSLAGTGNQAFLKFDYYNQQYGAFGSSEYIGSDSVLLADGSTPNNQWTQRTLTAVAPSGATEARVAIVFRQPDNQSGSIYVDDIQFQNFDEDELVAVESISVPNGSIFIGGVGLITGSDDSDLILQSEQTPDPSKISVLFAGTTSVQNPSSVAFEIETSVNTAGLELAMSALNFQTGQFDHFAITDTSLVDDMVTAELPQGNLTDYLNPADNSFLFQATWNQTDTVVAFPWRVSIDKACWRFGR
ncbi:MAG: hypothetical protein AAGA30_04675, partial [Planctomycetota bacterium]